MEIQKSNLPELKALVNRTNNRTLGEAIETQERAAVLYEHAKLLVERLAISLSKREVSHEA